MTKNEKRILIVDDHSELRLLVRSALDDGDGYVFREATTGREAILAAVEFEPRMVLLDVMLPDGIDGYRVCEFIKSHPRLGFNTHVILLTARGQQADEQRGRAAGADQYLIKPFSPLALAELVATAFENMASLRRK